MVSRLLLSSVSRSNLSSGTATVPTLGSIVQNGKLAACAWALATNALNKVDLPTLGNPTIPALSIGGIYRPAARLL